ncbi:MAG TPA: OmpA family protein [Pseudomonadales bacterium]|nr:OmpA family protein [Pseudomonadales bacterium]
MLNHQFIAYFVAIPLLLTGCSHVRYGEDIVFSHSLPPKAEISQCRCEPATKTQEQLQVTVYFGTDLYSLNEEATTTLESLVNAIDERDIEKLTIVGHTDSRASDDYNVTLSQRRAQAVIDFLKGRGLRSKDVSLSWQGEKAPAADNSTDSGKALNRRSVVTAEVISR